MKENIFLYYTNDLHSHFENWSKIVGHWNKQRKHHEKRNEPMFLIDIGDHVDRFHPIAEAMQGKANVELLNKASYDVATIGNNEGITLTHEDLFTLYDQADFDVVCANLANKDGKDPSWLKPYTLKATENGTTLGLIGLTAPFKAFYELLGWEVTSPFELLDQIVMEVKEQADIVVLLSHLGINDDQEIARRYDDIDLIIGGHTHHLFKDGEKINNTLLTAAGKHGVYVGEVVLSWDTERKQLNQKQAYAYEVNHTDEDQATKDQLAEYQEKADVILRQPVAHLYTPLHVNWFQESHIMKELVHTLKDWTSADCAMLNAGVLLDGFSQGDVTRGDIHRICPHPMNPCRVALQGDELLEVVRQAHAKRFMELKLKGFGFRGEIIGRMIFSGIEVVTETDSEGDEHVKRVTLQGEAIDLNKTYQVATADTFTFGKLLPEISHSPSKHYYMPELLRDLLTHTIKRIT
ncbi:bifunctional metallophosphatase/5'-nucleotidase [Pontibacillus yanchengensis]|uniref:Bifunctional metallophosphatase/5'-nucleotidase n=2 Tax=Pontibacillus yanchengensis TaxID=462910 RepID=A0ACC7VM72_9BACI|nr:bifunctional UDP-sugar hydrolase/5'-nucleotidase [Pontibacillus yanchengensis]MYL33727.1 bifunctional metallophosphatase/5'-nucleotidase [Pontibacillus yanchengensis]MYL55375.1 bifunctional metallophosphatase/5'-nucleotidase [Pontibacillus yanchengensis]